MSAAGRDIGPIPEIADVRRRARCRKSLRKFCETYNPQAFALGWSDDHLRVIARIEEAATRGALYAFAMPRGSGKTTICRMAALWAISYHHCRYVFVIGANAGKAEDSLASIKMWVRFLADYVADFPEIAYPVGRLNGIAHRAAGQTCQGEPTMIEWAKERITFPTVPPPANWPKAWRLRHDGMSPTSGAVLSAAGLTSDGIRGSLLTLTTGETIRPDLVLLDDPQTPESATSATQNESRERLISADVLGMAGPGKTISAVMPCTVIAPGDMVDSVLDRKKHPLWRGERTRLLRSMPEKMGAWDRYFEAYRDCVAKEPPDFAAANEWYISHRDELDAGAAASWPARKLAGEVSAVQHAMHLWFRDPVAFASEYQNDPLPLVQSDVAELKPDQVAARINRHARRLTPAGATRLTAMIDVQQDLLYYAVCGWHDDFTGHIVDYGEWPEQGRAYFTLREARPTLSQATGIASLEGSLFAALTKLADLLLGKAWPVDGGGDLRIERLMVDANWGESTDVVYRWARQSPHSALILPSHGKAIGASGNPMGEWPTKPGERRGLNWVSPPPKPGRVRYLLYDTNWWKSFVAGRLAIPPGERGGLDLFGDSPHTHRLFADHLCAEYRVRTSGRGREVDEWKIRPHRPDNHWWDGLVGCAVAASYQGCQPGGQAAQARQPRQRVSWAEMQRKRREGKPA